MAYYEQKAFFNDEIPGSTAAQPTVQAGLTVINAKADSELVLSYPGVAPSETVFRAHELVFVEEGSNVVSRSHSAAELEVTSPACLVFASFAGRVATDAARRAALRQVKFFGIAKTEPQGTTAMRTPHAAGVAVQVGGAVTIKNRSDQMVLAGQSLMWDVPLEAADDVGRFVARVKPYNPHTAAHHAQKMHLYMRNMLDSGSASRDACANSDDAYDRIFDALMSMVLTGVVTVLNHQNAQPLTEQQIVQYAQLLGVLPKKNANGAPDATLAAKIVDNLFASKYTPNSRQSRKSGDSTILPLRRGASSDASKIAAKTSAQMDKLIDGFKTVFQLDKSRIFATAMTTAAPNHFVDIQLNRHV